MTHRIARSAVLSILAGCAVAAAAAPGTAAGAAIGVQDDVLSSAPLERLAERVELVERSGAKVTRFDTLWSLVAPTRPADPDDPADPAYRWERVDAIVRGLDSAGIVPITTVYSAPAWAAGGRGAPAGREVNPNAPSPAQLGLFMRALATRYSGGYRAAEAEESLPAIDHYEIWNEPNLEGFLRPQFRGSRPVALQTYVGMLEASYGPIKRANPRAMVIAGVGGPRSSTSPTGTGALLWLQRVAGSAAPFDAYSQHVYPAAPPLADSRAIPSWATMPDLIDALDAYPRHRGKPVYVTEAGYTTATTPFRTVRVTEGQQAAYLRQIAALDVVSSPRVPLVVWFNLEDNRFWPGGLRDASGREKPSWDAFVPLARASVLPPELSGRARGGGGGPFRVSPAQLRVNQRISQAAVRRSNAVQRALDAGVAGEDIRVGALAQGAFDQGVAFTGSADRAAPAPLRRARIDTAAPGGRRAARVVVSAGQVRINQRISQAAVRRSNAVGARLDAGLTGGDVRDGTIPARAIDPGLTLVRAVDPAAEAAPSRTPAAPRPSGPQRPRPPVTLSAAQLLINQRIAQAAVRRSNALLDRLAAGLTAGDLRPGTLSARDLAPALRATAAPSA